MTYLGDRDLVLERIFDASRDRVYRAFTDPEEMAAWFGPVGYSVPLESIDMDVRSGGHRVRLAPAHAGASRGYN